MYYAAYTLQGGRLTASFRARWTGAPENAGRSGTGRWHISLHCPGAAGRQLHCYVAAAGASPFWGAHAGTTDAHGRLTAQIPAPAARLDRVWLTTTEGRVVARTPGAPSTLPRELTAAPASANDREAQPAAGTVIKAEYAENHAIKKPRITEKKLVDTVNTTADSETVMPEATPETDIPTDKTEAVKTEAKAALFTDALSQALASVAPDMPPEGTPRIEVMEIEEPATPPPVIFEVHGEADFLYEIDERTSIENPQLAPAADAPPPREPIFIEFNENAHPEAENCLPMDVPADEPPMQPLHFCPVEAAAVETRVVVEEAAMEPSPADASAAPATSECKIDSAANYNEAAMPGKMPDCETDASEAAPPDAVSVWEALAARSGITRRAQDEPSPWSSENLDTMLLDPPDKPCAE